VQGPSHVVSVKVHGQAAGAGRAGSQWALGRERDAAAVSD